jgi:hypothetical protein
MGKGVVVLQYVYGVSREGYVACEGLVEIVPDLTKKFLDLVITKKRLSEVEEKDYELTYLGKIED